MTSESVKRDESQFIELRVNTWKNFNSRYDGRRAKWFRVDTRIFTSPDLVDFTAAEKWSWMFILGQCCDQNSHEIRINLVAARRIHGLKFSVLESAIKKLERNQSVEVISCRKDVEAVAKKSALQYSTNKTRQDRHSATRAKPPNPKPETPAAQDALPGIASQPIEILGTPASRVIGEYHGLWKIRHGGRAPVLPKDRSLLSLDTTELGESRMLRLLEAYFVMPDAWFISRRHDVATFHSNLSKISAFADTGEFMTASQARQIDRSATTMNQLERIRRGDL